MHPAYKLAYFRKAAWPEDWIQEARRLITHEWTMRYKPAAPAANATAPSGGPPQASRELFASISAWSGQGHGDALEAYLEAPPLATVKDPLVYWNTAIKSSSENATLAHMALDFLLIPGVFELNPSIHT
ncbi:hypothetical protein BD311DRAFT_661945 [Dichomitus squalens]|uniref:HAT C-terminal dimerisation domain-containing protein n=1 Tax=Dichomitus squalens TaxID=114155 RepID=A0A4V2K0K2_9APHY|nr:hypothetical protein BD311DRAFT_661945 [Dichomitus squalens]